jgi:signal transduction histidine kinase/HAMP domain-containing protein
VRPSLFRRLSLGLIYVAALLLLVSLVAVSSLRRLGGAVGTILRENYASVIACHEMNEALERLDSAALFATSGQEGVARELIEHHRPAFAQALGREAANITLPGEGELVAHITEDYARYLERSDALMASPPEARRDRYFYDLLPRFYALKADIGAIRRMNQQNMEDADQEARRLARRGTELTLAVSALALVLALVLAWWLPRVILRPLDVFREGARRVGEGDFSGDMPAPGVAELVPLGEAFGTMIQRLRAYRESSLGELLAARDLARTTVECLLDPVVVVDRGGVILLANEAAGRALGVHEGIAADPALPDPLRQAVSEVMASGTPVLPSSLSEAVRVTGPEGDRHFVVRAAPLHAEPGETPRVLLTAQDVTRFRRIDDLKSNVVATVSHELKTPLTSLRMATHMLLDPRMGALTEAQQELVTTARDDTERLRGLVDEFLDLARIEAEAGALRRMPVRPARLLDAVADTHRALATAREVSLLVEVDEALDPAPLDPEKMSIALGNLVANALEHTPPGGRVVLRAAREGDQLSMSVQDSGEGIDERDLPHVFERFRRGAATTPDPRRIGLGLALTREITRQHGGAVLVTSQRGQGSTFTLRLPVG